MLVIGFNSEQNSHFYADLDIDPSSDSPRKIHTLLSKKAVSAGHTSGGPGATFTSIIVIENDSVVSEYVIDEDYDLTEEDDEEDDLDEDDEDADPDDLHEDDEDTDE